MPLQLVATPEQLHDLKRIASLGPNELDRVAEALARLPTPPLSPKSLVDAVSAVIARSEAEPLVRQLLSLQSFAVHADHEIEEVLDGVAGTIEEQGGGVGVSVEAWRAVEPAMKTLIESKAVRLPSRAMDLAFDYTNLLRQVRIITDIRPLFDQPAQSIEAAVVSHTLRLFYVSSDGEHELSIAMNESEVVALREQCERAIRKAAEAKRVMESSCKIPTSIRGEV